VQGYRTGYVYREPPVSQADEGKPVQHSEVVVPPTVSSYMYSFEEDTGKEPKYVWFRIVTLTVMTLKRNNSKMDFFVILYSLEAHLSNVTLKPTRTL